jgi:hypothetical protein
VSPEQWFLESLSYDIGTFTKESRGKGMAQRVPCQAFEDGLITNSPEGCLLD